MAATKLPWKVVTRDGVRGLMLPAVDVEEIDHEPDSTYGGSLDERFLPFAKPGMRVEAKSIYTVKGVHKDGTVVQLPLEDQINNNVASPETFLGLQAYIRKGMTVFFDPMQGIGAFCPTWACWAEWNDKNPRGFCCEAHMKATIGENEAPSGFAQNATTSSTWSM